MFIYITIAYILGILLSITFNVFKFWYIFVILNFIFGYLVFKYQQSRYFYAILLLVFFSLGTNVSNLRFALNNTIVLDQELPLRFIFGKITKIESSYFSNKQNIYLNDIIINDSNDNFTKPSIVKLSYSGAERPKVGDIVKVRASLFLPSKPLLPHGFNFAKNSLLNNIGASGYIIGDLEIIETAEVTLREKLFKKILQLQNYIRLYIIKQINKMSTPDVGAFLASIVVGEYDFLPSEGLEDLRNSGLAHLISISGYHITILSAAIFLLSRTIMSLIPKITLKYNTKKLAALVTIGFLLFYMFIVGNHPPAIRASIMALSVFLSVLLNFTTYGMSSLFLAVFIILTVNPFAIYSAGFILSAFSTLIIIAFVNLPIIRKLHAFKASRLINYPYKILFYILSLFLVTIVVEIAISPILAFYFGSIPVLSVFANALAAPLFSFILMPSILLYLITPFIIGQYFLIVANFSTYLILKIANFFANYKINDYALSKLYIVNVYQYLLVAYLILAVIFLSINYNKHNYKYISYIKYLSLSVLIVILGYCVYLQRYPNIIVDGDAKLIAFKEGDSKTDYIFSSKGEKFIKKIWFKDTNVDYAHVFAGSIYFNCIDKNCATKQNNYIISFLVNIEDYSEACKESDLIILQDYKPYACSKALVIDKHYLNKHGATTIYLNKTNIKLVSNN